MHRTVPVLGLLVLLSGCASGLDRPVHEVTAQADPSGVQRVRLVAHSFYFEPNRIVVRAGAPVELRIRNAALMVPHNFSVIAPEAGITVRHNLSWIGRTATVRFVPDEPGEYTFFCAVDGHAHKGMKGTLVVR